MASTHRPMVFPKGFAAERINAGRRLETGLSRKGKGVTTTIKGFNENFALDL